MRAIGRPPRWGVGDVIDGRYEVTAVHEDGGMGLVYRARHRSWATDLAVKSPRPEMFANPADREMFVAEAEAWVSLGLHPNVCGCHYVRLLDGVPLVFAEYVPGGSLRQHIIDRRLYAGGEPAASARVLDLAVQIAWGLQHAHDNGLVHQDVKPANVLIDGAGTAKVTDFGLARARAGSGRHRDAGPDVSVLVSAGGLTPAYASPEQAAGRPLSRRTDVYSYAVSVLEMYTGGVTWMTGPAARHVLAALRTDGPGTPGPPPLPGELAELLDRCLRDDPAERPASMARIAEAVAGIYARVTGRDHPRPVPVAAKLRADELNNRALSLLDLDRADEAREAFAAALSSDPRHLAATYNAGLLRWRQGIVTDTDLLGTVEALLHAGDSPWEARRLLAQIHLERGDLAAAVRHLDEALAEQPDDADLLAARKTATSGGLLDAQKIAGRSMPWYVYVPRTETHMGMTLPVSPPLIDVVPSADGRVALTSSDGVVRAWDLHSGEAGPVLEGAGSSVDLSADGRLALTGSSGELQLWTLPEGRLLDSRRAPEDWPEPEIMEVRLSGDATVALASIGRGRVMVWDIASGVTRPLFDGHNWQSTPEISRDGTLVLSAAWEDRAIRLWEVATGECLLTIPPGRGAVTAMRIRDDNRTAAIAFYDHRLELWDLREKRLLRRLNGPTDGSVRTIALSGDGRHLLEGGFDHFGMSADGPDLNSLRLWDLRDGRCLRTFPEAHFGQLRGIELTDGAAVTVGKDAVRWWSLPLPHTAAWQLSRPRRHEQLDTLDRRVAELVGDAESAAAEGDHAGALDLLSRARAVPGHERAERVLSAWRTLGRSVRRAGLRAGWQARTLDGHTGAVFSIAVSADARIAVSAGLDAHPRVWDLATGECLHVLPKQPSSVDNVGVSADGRRAVSACRDGAVGVWSTETGEPLRLIDGQRTLGASPAAFSADAGLALIGSVDGAIRLWDLTAGEPLRTVESGIIGPIAAVAISADGGLGASAGGGEAVRVWDLTTGERTAVLSGHQRRVDSVCLSADARFALTAEGRTVRWWDTGSGRLLRVFDAAPDGIRVVRFSPDGRFALSGGRDRALRVWEVESGRCVAALVGHQSEVSGLAVTPDSRFALTGGGDGSMRLWELDWELAAGPGGAR
ncbi:protein kinase [Phytomonospora sp. NPDC050363]|uniref:protein kinase domain-containing protein n=1 Tax=Phytomonospora sp. NPDC050363 TaxID=3155642 RepID=UPI0033F574B7